ncbi:hypothetical protein SDJN03_05527, partial [Cucurbita argyrosperma subsp. sororia]
MGGGNGQKAKMAREKNLEKQKGAKGSQLDSNKKAMTIQCKVCMQTFMCTTSEVKLNNSTSNCITEALLQWFYLLCLCMSLLTFESSINEVVQCE